jgi:hypothetical protein
MGYIKIYRPVYRQLVQTAHTTTRQLFPRNSGAGWHPARRLLTGTQLAKLPHKKTTPRDREPMAA